MNIFVNLILCLEFYSKVLIDQPVVYSTRASSLQTNLQTSTLYLTMHSVY